MELSVDVSADDDWSSDWGNIRLLREYFPGLSEGRVTFSQRALTSDSGRGLQVRMVAIC